MPIDITKYALCRYYISPLLVPYSSNKLAINDIGKHEQQNKVKHFFLKVTKQTTNYVQKDCIYSILLISCFLIII